MHKNTGTQLTQLADAVSRRMAMENLVITSVANSSANQLRTQSLLRENIRQAFQTWPDDLQGKLILAIAGNANIREDCSKWIRTSQSPEALATLLRLSQAGGERETVRWALNSLAAFKDKARPLYPALRAGFDIDQPDTSLADTLLAIFPDDALVLLLQAMPFWIAQPRLHFMAEHNLKRLGLFRPMLRAGQCLALTAQVRASLQQASPQLQMLAAELAGELDLQHIWPYLFQLISHEPAYIGNYHQYVRLGRLLGKSLPFDLASQLQGLYNPALQTSRFIHDIYRYEGLCLTSVGLVLRGHMPSLTYLWQLIHTDSGFEAAAKALADVPAGLLDLAGADYVHLSDMLGYLYGRLPANRQVGGFGFEAGVRCVAIWTHQLCPGMVVPDMVAELHAFFCELPEPAPGFPRPEVERALQCLENR